jgi:hypothetical protein
MQSPGDYPAITTIVSRPRSHEHAGTKQMRVAIREDDGDRPPGTLHERGEFDAGTDGEPVPAVGLFGGEDGDGQGEK